MKEACIVVITNFMLTIGMISLLSFARTRFVIRNLAQSLVIKVS